VAQDDVLDEATSGHRAPIAKAHIVIRKFATTVADFTVDTGPYVKTNRGRFDVTFHTVDDRLYGMLAQRYRQRLDADLGSILKGEDEGEDGTKIRDAIGRHFPW
jgi:hypothetical protein